MSYATRRPVNVYIIMQKEIKLFLSHYFTGVDIVDV